MSDKVIMFFVFMSILFSGCQQQRAVDFDKAMNLLSKCDPNSLGKVTEKLFSQQQKRELAEIKVNAEANAYKKQENWKITLVLGMGACIVIVIAGIWFGNKLIVALAIAGFLGCGSSWGLIFAGLQYAKLIGLVTTILCLAIGVSLFAVFVYSVFKHRKALVQVVLGNEKYKTRLVGGEDIFKTEQKEVQDKATEKIVNKIRNGK